MATSPIVFYFIVKRLLREFRLLRRDRRERYDTIDDMRLNYSGKRTDGGIIIIDKERSKHFFYPPIEKWLAKRQQKSPNLRWEFGFWYHDYAAPHEVYRYDEHSVCIAINGLETQEFLKLAADILKCVQINETLAYDHVSGICYVVDLSTFVNHEMNPRTRSYMSSGYGSIT